MHRRSILIYLNGYWFHRSTYLLRSCSQIIKMTDLKPVYDLRFKNPSSFILGGASQSGKTTFTFNLLRYVDVLFENPKCKQNIIYYYNQWQDLFENFQHENIVTKWVNKLPTTEDVKEQTWLFKNDGGSILVIDDFAQKLNQDIVDVFSVLCHHTNSVVILLTQNIFSKNKVFRDVSLNSTYGVLFKNARDLSQINYFARQFSPGKNSYIVEAFKKATLRPYSYMLFDFHQATPEHLRVRSNVLPNDGPMKVWLPKEISV
jgi:hypothetical protein